MTDDLADRISDGVVAVLELVPGEQRFADLSRFVMKGGASRFHPVILDEEPIRYVLPVGVPGRKLDFGALLIQATRCALVWRTDPSRPFHALVMTLGPATTVAQSAVTVRSETWGRFDLRDPQGSMTFLVPPVASPALPRALHRALVVEPHSHRGAAESTPLSPSITEGDMVTEDAEGTTNGATPPAEPTPPARLTPPSTPVAPAATGYIPVGPTDVPFVPPIPRPLFRDEVSPQPSDVGAPTQVIPTYQPPTPVPPILGAPIQAPPIPVAPIPSAHATHPAGVTGPASAVALAPSASNFPVETDDDTDVISPTQGRAEVLKGFLVTFIATLVVVGVVLIVKMLS
jgi:hypothetical protein